MKVFLLDPQGNKVTLEDCWFSLCWLTISVSAKTCWKNEEKEEEYRVFFPNTNSVRRCQSLIKTSAAVYTKQAVCPEGSASREYFLARDQDGCISKTFRDQFFQTPIKISVSSLTTVCSEWLLLIRYKSSPSDFSFFLFFSLQYHICLIPGEIDSLWILGDSFSGEVNYFWQFWRSKAEKYYLKFGYK